MKTEWRIVCSGKGKPWHTESRVTQHTHTKRDVVKADADADYYNEHPLTPLQHECRPWRLQKRVVGEWQDDNDG